VFILTSRSYACSHSKLSRKKATTCCLSGTRQRGRGEGREGKQRHHLEYALLGLVVDERDDARSGGLDELDVGGGDVGCRRAVADPSPSAVPRVRDDTDHGAAVHGGVRRRGAHPGYLPGARQPDDPRRRRRRRRRRRGQEDRQEQREQVEAGRRVHMES
jgi:hypothetical protein